jgi:rRNA small subunit pseudouridine methyltransferase Nep1
MVKLQDSEKRGRPDLVHAALLSVTGSPLYLDGKVRMFVHTYPGLVLEIAGETRLPKNYFRFRGLMEKTLSEKPRDGLVSVMQVGMNELVRKEIRPDPAIGFSVRGRSVDLGEIASKVAGARNPCLFVGGFPHGHFAEGTTKALDDLVRIDPRPLEAHVVAARVIYEVEKATNRIND